MLAVWREQARRARITKPQNESWNAGRVKRRSHGREVDEALALRRINVKPGWEAEIASKLVAAPSRLIRLTGRRPLRAIGAHVKRRRIFFVATARDKTG